MPGRTFQLGDQDGNPIDLTVTLESVRPYRDGLLARLEGTPDRTAAELLQGRTLIIPIEEAEPLEEEEYFLHDVIGLEVVDPNGDRLGRVMEVYTVGTSHLLGIDDGRREVLVPFSEAVVHEVDLDAGRVVIEPTPGLLDV